MRPPLHPFRSASLALLCAGVLAGPGAAAQAIGRGFDLERAGRLADAAEVYLGTLRADSTNLAALLGLERVLPTLARPPELLPLARRALAADSASAALRALLLRTYVGMNERDSARAVSLRWAAAAPHSEAPYREWAIALEDRQLMDEARGVLLQGRRALGQPAALAVELAELLAHTGDWEGAAREWAAAVTADPAQSPSGASLLGEVPDSERERVARVLTAGEASREARRLGAELLLGWGQPQRAWTVFEATIDPPSSEVVYALHRFADRAGAWSTPDARRVRALALSRFAALVPPQMAVRARADAARAFTAAGDRAAARAELALVAADPTAPPDVHALAETALLETLIEDGQLDSAAARLAGAGDKLNADDRAALELALARARIARGELARADSGLAGDSSVNALALRGWIALYRGELTQAATLFRAAGPYALDRRDATQRTAMLALLAHIPQNRLPDLGRALLLLARADSTATVAALRRAADQLGADGGRPDVLLLAGRVAARLDPAAQRTAAQLFEEVVRTGGPGAAPPAAELEWTRLLVRQGRAAEAVQHLEHLILTYPGSAVVPEARRELDQARGAIPRS